VWYDNRTSEIVKEIIDNYGSADAFRNKTGLVLSTYFSALKLCWLLKNVPIVLV
jgi:glycerol kinase